MPVVSARHLAAFKRVGFAVKIPRDSFAVIEIQILNNLIAYDREIIIFVLRAVENENLISA